MSHSSLTALSVAPSSALRDGTTLVVDGVLLVGTRRLTEVEYAGELGRHIVRRGMADVLAWLGETVGLPPVYQGRGERLLAMIRHLTANGSPLPMSAEGEVSSQADSIRAYLDRRVPPPALTIAPRPLLGDAREAYSGHVPTHTEVLEVRRYGARLDDLRMSYLVAMSVHHGYVAGRVTWDAS